MALLDKIKKFNREHQPQALRPKAKAASAAKAPAKAKPAAKPAKAASAKPKAKARSENKYVPKKAAVPADKPTGSKIAVRPEGKIPFQSKIAVRPAGIGKNNKGLMPKSATNLKIVPKGRKYSGGILSGLFKSK